MSEQPPEPVRERPLGTDDGVLFWAGVAERILPIQSCTSCQALHHPPKVRCDRCGSFDLTTVAAQGGGAVYSFALPRHPPDGRNPPGTAFVVVELDEGVRVFSNLVDLDGLEPRIGMRVELYFDRAASTDVLPLWRPAAEVRA